MNKRIKRIELNSSGVIFNKEEHTYELNGRKLTGITEMLQRQLFPDEYTDIPWQIVKKAGEYGTSVHESCERFDAEWQNDGTVELQSYIEICKENGLIHEASEYTVTDGITWASNIDKVFRYSEDTFDLADIKTYGKLDSQKLEKARWQLSIYAYLFELVNPKAKVNRLMVIHIRNKEKKDGTFDYIKEVKFVERIPKETITALLKAEEEGRQYLQKDTEKSDNDKHDESQGKHQAESQGAGIVEDEDRIRELIRLKEEVEEELTGIKNDMMLRMEQLDLTSYVTEGGMKLTRKIATTRSTFDLARFKESHPEIDYDSYMKTSQVSQSLTIAI